MIIFYDGDCGLCDRSVHWILRRDRERKFQFSPLAGETARNLLGVNASKSESVILWTGERALYRSDAALSIVSELQTFWSWLGILKILPRVLRDLPYLAIARSRRWLWKNQSLCLNLGPNERQRFLP
jgi:predicted DCC family thiol-disulfide oxidoreductase YuxK